MRKSFQTAQAATQPLACQHAFLHSSHTSNHTSGNQTEEISTSLRLNNYSFKLTNVKKMQRNKERVFPSCLTTVALQLVPACWYPQKPPSSPHHGLFTFLLAASLLLREVGSSRRVLYLVFCVQLCVCCACVFVNALLRACVCFLFVCV